MNLVDAFAAVGIIFTGGTVFETARLNTRGFYYRTIWPFLHGETAPTAQTGPLPPRPPLPFAHTMRCEKCGKALLAYSREPCTPGAAASDRADGPSAASNDDGG